MFGTATVPIEPQSAEIDVHAVAEACLDLMRPAAQAKNLALSITMAPDTPRWMVTDPTRLRQMLLNLLSNAVKLTSRGSVQIRLHPMTGDMALRIEVADTGPGISAGPIPQLPREVEQPEIIRVRPMDGDGSGVALSARLASLMGGRLRHADNPDGGSLFWLELPLNTAGAGPKSVAAERDRPLHVLVVDDVAMSRDIAGAFLRAAGHHVTCLDGGAAAVAAVADTDFDVVFMDVRMPGMDGLEATRRIRALGGVRGHVPIIALTARAFSDQVSECRGAGMNDHLAKPFDPDALHAVVMRAFTARQMPREERLPVAAREPLPVADIQPRVFDLRVFERTAIFLMPDMVVSHLDTVTRDAEALLRGLREPDALTSSKYQLAETAHMLSGTAGMFGFDQLTMVCRHFERAILSETAELQTLASTLSVALETMLDEIHRRVSVAVSTGLDLARSVGHDEAPSKPGAVADNAGGRLWMQLPVEGAGAPSAAPVVPTDLPNRAAAGAIHVLVVDDDALTRDIASALLRSTGNEVTCVASGAEAVDAAAMTDFDVVLMDVRMPGMDGLEATRRIRSLHGVRGRVPIVALTARAFTEQVAECRAAGMDDHLRKPFYADTLNTAVLRATGPGQLVHSGPQG